jgi:hypothetical protein
LRTYLNKEVRKMKKIIFVILLILTYCSTNSFAGGGGGGGGMFDKGPHDNDRSNGGPSYYSFEELREQLKIESFHFENANKPANALISLGYLMNYPLCSTNNTKIMSAIKMQPTSYKVDSASVSSLWADGGSIVFDWDLNRGQLWKGDLIFTRGDGKMHDFIKIFSNLTHVAIVVNPLDNSILESTIDYGVRVDKVPNKWTGFGYYTCKRIEGLPYGERDRLVDVGMTRFKDLPYLPKISTFTDIFMFVSKWCDKNDMDSMYCSKLVYNVFKPYFNLDTGRTVVTSGSGLKDPAPGSYLFSWVGVSPDDIYYSPMLGPDYCYSANIIYL